MAHNLNLKADGSAAFFTVKEKAWHGLGTILDTPPTAAEAIVHAGLDYEVERTPVLALIGGEHKPVADKFVTYRTDSGQPFNVVGSRYTVLQNRDAFGFFDAIVGEGEAIYETAGALGMGERIFITAKLPGYIRVGKDDLIEQYIFLTNTHDGSGAVTAAFTPIRIVCNNTLNAAMGNKSNCISIRHTATVERRVKDAHKLMGIVNQLSEQMEQCFNRMANVRITDVHVRRLIEEAMNPQREQMPEKPEYSTRFRNMVDGVLTYTFAAPSQQLSTTKGTLFGVYNGITGYFQNAYEHASQEAKLDSVFWGNAGKKSQLVFDELQKICAC